jgi:mRNA interferase HigB
MRVHLIKRKTIENFVAVHPQFRQSFTNWLMKLRFAEWNEPGDIKSTFRSSDFLGNGSNRVIFDIAGNNCRMICKYVFGNTSTHLFICWIGSHAAYDKLCKNNLQYTINSF